MKALALTFFVHFSTLSCVLPAPRDYPVQPVPFTRVHLRDSFWAPRIEINRKVTIPFAFKMDEETGRVDNFLRAAQALRGEPLANTKAPGFPFDDTDLYKVIEGASYALSVKPDAQLDAYLDKLIAIIAAAQERDGYLYTTRTIDPAHPHEWAGARRWEMERDLSHELYNLGHLYEAAVAHHQATGKRSLLDVALRTADLLDRTFGPGKEVIWPGHQITEMGLAKLYRATGEERYLKLAKFLLDARGPDGHKASGKEYNQSHAKVTAQSEAVGHAVRATYMYSGMADVAALTGDRAYADAIARIWENVVAKKLYITGGIGATNHGEAFGADYELPNMTAYNETCAAIGNDYWNHRLFLMHGDARYIDVLERTLYNGTISGVSLDGKGFFYPNPLESNGQHARSPWFGCACCPGNMTRFLASVPGYVYARSGDGVWVNLYVASDAEIDLDGGLKVKLKQETRYPWDGAVRLTASAGRYALRLRIPGWARNEPVPSDLYRYADRAAGDVVLKVNGRAVEWKLEKGYALLDRDWKQGDTVDLTLPMAVRRVVSHEAVAANRGRVALERGPIVYAAEWADNPGGKVRHLMLADTSVLTAEHRPALLGGVTVVKTQAEALARRADGSVEKTQQELTLIPYATWANRGKGQMMVWLPREESAARPMAYPLPSMSAEVRTSGKKNARMMQDGEVPSSSADASSYFDWWPEKGREEWVEYTFAQPVTVSRSRVYWFDDTGRGEVRVPAGWRLLYKDGEAWKPVAAAQVYGVEKDRYNEVTFAAVTTRALRLEVQAQEKWSVGIQEWEVHAAAPGDRIRALRRLDDATRAQVTKELALEIRALPSGAEKWKLATGLANLATEGDFGRDTLQDVTTTLELALREKPSEQGYASLAQLVRYEGMKAAPDHTMFAEAMKELEALDRVRAAADFELKDLTGRLWSLRALKGKVVVVNFWATWCPPCRKEMPDLEALYREFQGKGLVVLAISDEAREKVEPFIAEKQYTFPVLLDEGRKVSEALKIEGIPKTFVYDREGKLAAQSIDMRTRGQFLAMLERAGLK